MNCKNTAIAAVLAIISATPAMAQDGLASMHSMTRIGRMLCMTEHFHFGQSSGAPSRKAAEIAAIRDWSSFTSWEYGNVWGDFRIAGSRGIKCTRSGNTWGCSVEARPCRR